MTERPALFNAPMVRAILVDRKTKTRRLVKPQPTHPSFGSRKMLALDDEGIDLYLHGGPLLARAIRSPLGRDGDRLWVRESLIAVKDADENIVDYAFAADGAKVPRCPELGPQFSDGMAFAHLARPGGVPSIHMPRWACRILADVTDVNVERLQEITEEDARAEGCVAQLTGAWWQGYKRMSDGELIHQQSQGDAPPEWMVEPHRMASTPHLDLSAVDVFRSLWISIYGAESWDANPWVWVTSFRRVTA